jgi:hypothetical protein
VASLTLPASLPAGSYNLTFNYSGDANYAAASKSRTFTVLAAAGLPSTTTASISGTFSPASDGITVSGTVTGQAGQPAPTGSVVIFANGNIVDIALFASSSGDVSSYSELIPSAFLGPGTNLIEVQYGGDSVYNESSATLSPIQGEGADFAVQTLATTVPVAAGTSATTAIEVSSIQGFAGSVNLSCAAVPGVTCSITPSVTLAAGGSATATLTILASADTANLSYSVPVTATDSTGLYVHTLAVEGTVSGSPAGTQSFFLASNLPSLQMLAGVGANRSATITVWPLGGYSGTVSLTCAVSTTGGAVAPTCLLSKPSLAVSGTTPQTTTLTVVTMQGTTAQNRPKLFFWPAAGGSALALLLFFAVPRRRRNWLAMLLLLAAAVSVTGLGCGGNAVVVTPGTSIGTYTVTITGKAGSLTQTASVTVIVAP